MFENILGNDPVKAYLHKAIQENRLAQTLLFTGPEGVGKKLFALDIAKHFLGASSTDLHLLSPEGKTALYSIETLRAMIDREHASSYGERGKVFILDYVERMQPAAANALLKTLEEPTPDTTFILISNNPAEILPTILSRCTILQFHPLSTDAMQLFLAHAGLPASLAALSHGSPGKAQLLAQHPELTEQREILFSILRNRPTYPDLMQQLDKIESLFKEDEDPILVNAQAQALFAYLLMWHRDQHVTDAKFKFFPQEPKAAPVPLPKVEKAVDRARFAYSRNIKLSQCLREALCL